MRVPVEMTIESGKNVIFVNAEKVKIANQTINLMIENGKLVFNAGNGTPGVASVDLTPLILEALKVLKA